MNTAERLQGDDEMTDPDLTLLAFEHAPVGVVLAENRIIKTCNRTFAQSLGYDVGDLIGQSFRILYGSDDEFERLRNIGDASIQAKGRYTDERIMRHKSGHSVWFRFRAHSMTPEAPTDRAIMTFAQINDAAPQLSFSKREREVLALMNQGLTSKEIARELGLSPRTIEDVRARLIKRFGVKRSTDILAHMAGISG